MKRLEEALHRNLPAGEEFVKLLPENVSRWKHDLLRTIHQEGAGQVHLLNLNKMVNSDSPQITREQEERVRGRVIHKLAFANMMDRERRISKAHQRTFEWIFQEPDDSCRPWSSFRNFLQDPDNKMYWITGKPGSGKSTLMKFIRYSPQTSILIEKWAAGQDVVQAAFYFWNSGLHMQMSVEGLLQTLLHDCLRQLPRFVQQTLPERWEAATLFDEDDFPWCFDEVARALKRLMTEICPDKKFLFMIDGLDECSGDHSQLIELLFELSDDIPNVKLCLASRPYNNFEDGFRGKSSLLLQDLTRADMEIFIDSKFQENEGFKELRIRDPESVDDLLKDLLRKAEGVFLWVHLVVQSLLAGLTNGDGLQELQCRLAELPPALEDLYESILHHLDPRYLDHASRLFQIVREYQTFHYGGISSESPTLLRVALADLDGQVAFQAPVRPQTEEEILALCKNMRRKLLSRCHGLLEVSPSHDSDDLQDDSGDLRDDSGDLQDDSSTASSSLEDDTDQEDNGANTAQIDGPLADQEVQYLHRSVRDYIESPRVWNWLLSVNRKPFNLFLAFLRSSLLQLKYLSSDLYPHSLARRSVAKSTPGPFLHSDSISGSKMGLRIWAAISFAKTALKESREQEEELEIVSLLEELDKTATLITNSSTRSMRIQTDQGTLGINHWATYFLRDISRVTFLHMMAVCGLHQYVARQYQKSDLSEHQNDPPLLLTVVEGKVDSPENPMWWFFESPNLEVLRVIMRNGGDCFQEYQGRSAWTVAKKRKQTKVLQLFQGCEPGSPALSARSASPAASHVSSIGTDGFDDYQGSPKASQNNSDTELPRLPNDRGLSRRKWKEISRARAANAAREDFDLESEDGFSSPAVLPKSRPGSRTAWGQPSRGVSSNGRNRHRPRNDRGLRRPLGQYEDVPFHEPAAHQPIYPLSRPRPPPPAPPPVRPWSNNYPHHHGPGPYGHYTDYGVYAQDHRHYDARYHSYHGSSAPPWFSAPRYYAPPQAALQMSPFVMLPNPFYPAGRPISYRSGRQGQQNLAGSFMSPFNGPGFPARTAW